ncbi:MAG: tol-pal system-associated acyl-CoA thioesterase [Pseudomonadota bacterium]
MRVYYEDTDFGGVVYYANYLKFFERARTEWLRALGVEQAQLREEHGLGFVVRRCAVEYLRPAVMDDVLTVRTMLRRRRAASLELRQTAHLASRSSGAPSLAIGVTLAEAEVTVACVDLVGKPTRLPSGLTSRLNGMARKL